MQIIYKEECSESVLLQHLMDCPWRRDLPLQAHRGLAFTFNAEGNQCTQSTQSTVITKYILILGSSKDSDINELRSSYFLIHLSML